MKTLKHLFTALLLMVATVAMAHDFEVGGIYYNILSEEEKTVEVTYRGNSSSSYSYTGSVDIPSMVTYNDLNYSVTSIGAFAFDGCSGLTSITIPNSVTSIGGGAFFSCSSLTSVTIPNSVTSIGDYAFFSCSGLTSITIPNSVTSIGGHAFWGCSGLIEVHISDLTSWCNIDFNDDGGNIFFDAHNLYLNGELVTELVIPDGVSKIKNYAFWGCSGLTSVTIPNSVTSIEYNAFYGCTGLTSVTIPNSVTSIGDEAFSTCTGLTNIVVDEGNSAYDSRDNCNAIIETVTNKLITGCRNTVIPNSVTSIGDSAFKGCTGLTCIIIPPSVTSIGDCAFYGCSGLTNVTIPNSVTSIGDYAFEYCTNLRVVINCSNLILSRGSTGYGYVAYYANKVIDVQNCLIDGNFIFGTINGVNTLVGYCGNDTKLTLPADYKGGNYAICDYAFFGCSGLTSVTIPNSVTSIGDEAFSNCTGLTSVTIGNSVTSIRYRAFYGCSRLTSVTIPNSVTSIGSDVFNGTAWLNNQPDGVIYAGKVLYKYKGLMPENTNITIKEGTLSIAYHVFSGCTGLTSVTIPNSVTSIGDYAFEECSGLTSVTIPNSVTSIGSSAFSGCSGLTSVTIPNSVTSIGSSAFSGCSGLTSVTIPNSVTSIGQSAFYGCSELMRVDIVDGVKSIGYNAFAFCSNLEELYISNTIESIGTYAFEGCTNILEIKVGSKKAITCSENIFSEDVYNNALLCVPEGRKFAYEKTAPWNRFYIVETDYTDINGVKEQIAENNTVYDLQGRKVENPTNGIYIVNGKKVFVK